VFESINSAYDVADTGSRGRWHRDLVMAAENVDVNPDPRCGPPLWATTVEHTHGFVPDVVGAGRCSGSPAAVTISHTERSGKGTHSDGIRGGVS